MRPLMQSAANGYFEPTLPIFCAADKVRFRYCWQNCFGMVALDQSFKCFVTISRHQLSARRAIASWTACIPRSAMSETSAA